MTAALVSWQAIEVSGPAIVLAAALATAALTALLLPLLRRFALAVPNARSSHRTVTPQGGGSAVVAVTLVIGALALLASPQADAGGEVRLLLVLAAALLLAVIGGIDDVRGLGLAPRLLAQVIAVAMMLASLPADLRLVPACPAWLETTLLFIGGVWFVNLVNFMDGIDWMMVAEMVPVTLGIAVIGMLGALPREALVVALALNGAMLGFAPFNRPVARLFLGDVGSLPVGLLVGWLLLLVAGAGHAAAAVLLPLYFIADATVTLFGRLRGGARFWEAHRTHFYQRAGDGGWSNMAIVVSVFAVNVVLAALAVATVLIPTPATQVGALLAGAALVGWLMAAFARGRS